jgi:hypothetical protein
MVSLGIFDDAAHLEMAEPRVPKRCKRRRAKAEAAAEVEAEVEAEMEAESLSSDEEKPAVRMRLRRKQHDPQLVALQRQPVRRRSDRRGGQLGKLLCHVWCCAV